MPKHSVHPSHAPHWSMMDNRCRACGVWQHQFDVCLPCQPADDAEHHVNWDDVAYGEQTDER